METTTAPINTTPGGGEKKNIPIQIVLADDHPIVRHSLKSLLQMEEDLIVVGEAGDGREVVEKVQELDPDVLVLDLRMPNLDGLSALQTMRQTNQHTKVIMFTASEDQNEFAQAVKLGCAILRKRTAPDLIVNCIRKVNSGENWLDSPAAASVMCQFSPGRNSSPRGGAAHGQGGGSLSTREREIVALMVHGYTNKEMAEKMFISKHTVKNHLSNIFHKLGVSARLDVVLYSIQTGLHRVGCARERAKSW